MIWRHMECSLACYYGTWFSWRVVGIRVSFLWCHCQKSALLCSVFGQGGRRWPCFGNPLFLARVPLPPQPCAGEQSAAQHFWSATVAGEWSTRDTGQAGRCLMKATNCRGLSQLQVFDVVFLLLMPTAGRAHAPVQQDQISQVVALTQLVGFWGFSFFMLGNWWYYNQSSDGFSPARSCCGAESNPLKHVTSLGEQDPSSSYG